MVKVVDTIVNWRTKVNNIGYVDIQFLPKFNPRTLSVVYGCNIANNSLISSS